MFAYEGNRDIFKVKATAAEKHKIPYCRNVERRSAITTVL